MKSARVLIPVLAAAGILFPAVFSAAFPHLFSTTRSFSFDGKRYTVVPSGESDISLIRRELAKAGIDLPPDTEEDPSPHPALSTALAQEEKDRPPRRLPIPESFGIEHTLRLLQGGGETEIVFGTTRQSPQKAARLLRARGWSCSAPSERDRGKSVATCAQGKERLLAFLEAKEGGFLLVRQVER